MLLEPAQAASTKKKRGVGRMSMSLRSKTTSISFQASLSPACYLIRFVSKYNKIQPSKFSRDLPEKATIDQHMP